MFRDRQAMAHCAPRPHERGESEIATIVVMERYELEHMPSLMQILSGRMQSKCDFECLEEFGSHAMTPTGVLLRSFNSLVFVREVSSNSFPSRTNSTAKYPSFAGASSSIFGSKTGDTLTVHLTGSFFPSEAILPGTKFSLESSPLSEEIMKDESDILSCDGFDSGSSREKNDFPITLSLPIFPERRWKAAFACMIE